MRSASTWLLEVADLSSQLAFIRGFSFDEYRSCAPILEASRLDRVVGIPEM
jgi:hypothetical protein